jgi:hypothetical protein
MKSLHVAALCVVSLLSASSAQAAFTTWTLNGIEFNDGGTASGSFTYDPASPEKVGTFDIHVNGGSFPAFEYTPANSTVANLGSSQIAFTSPVIGPNPIVDDHRAIDLVFPNFTDLPATPAPGTTFALIGASDGWPTTNRFGGATVGNPGELIASIPEPSSSAVMLSGVAVLLCLRRRFLDRGDSLPDEAQTTNQPQ